jgi:hypothetical protein
MEEERLNWLAERMLALPDWQALREASGNARDIPDAVLALAAADSEPKASEAYWRLDNNVVVQGQLFECALPLVSVILALLAGDLPEPARPRLLELLYQIVVGRTAVSEFERGNRDLAERCRTEVVKGLWLYYKDLLNPTSAVQKVALDLVRECESEEGRLLAVLLHLVDSESCSEIRDLAVILIEDLKAAKIGEA